MEKKHLIAPEGHYFANKDRSIIGIEIYLSDYVSVTDFEIITASTYEEIMEQKREEDEKAIAAATPETLI